MRIAALVKQIPKFETMKLGADGRLLREGIELEMNAYCRRAVAQAVVLAAARPGSSVTVITMGPATAADCLREAIAWGQQHGIADIDGVLISDRAFAGADTLATATTLRATIDRLGGFDLVLCGRNSVDADTGQVGPQLAELLGVPFVSAAKQLTLHPDGTMNATSESDDGFVELTMHLPAVVSCAERLIDPSKVDPAGRQGVDEALIKTITASMLGPGPWGAEGSPTWVGPIRTIMITRRRELNPNASLSAQIERALAIADELGAFDTSELHSALSLRDPVVMADGAKMIAVLVEPDRHALTAEMIGAAAGLARADTAVVALVPMRPGPAARASLGQFGADAEVFLPGGACEDDAAAAIGAFTEAHAPEIVLAPSTAWGREVASRVAARVGAGLCGDAVELELDADGRLIAWKPAFGGAMVAAIGCRSPMQMATVRAGVLGTPQRRAFEAPIDCFDGWSDGITLVRNRVTVTERTRDDDLDRLADARSVIAVGRGVEPSEYRQLQPLASALSAQWAATRKVTDNGWMPRARQLGITGRSIAPQLLVSVGAGGKFNHSVGFRNARCVLAINPDPVALIFDCADAGIVARWQDAAPLLIAELDRQGFSGR